MIIPRMEMPKVIFKFDKIKDLYNIWETCNSVPNWYDFRASVPQEIIQMCSGIDFRDCESNLLMLKKNIYDSGFLDIFTASIQEAWDIINDEFFIRLGKIMKQPVRFDKFYGYVTTIARCPYYYSQSLFMVSFFSGISHALATAGHEIMHMQFHNIYWKKIEKKIGFKNTSDLKEALTVLLNLEFRDLWYVDDLGYEPHRELRKFIADKWREEKDFDKLLQKCVRYFNPM